MSDWDEVRARLEEEARCMEQPEAQGTAEVAADIRAALQRVEELRSIVKGVHGALTDSRTVLVPADFDQADLYEPVMQIVRERDAARAQALADRAFQSENAALRQREKEQSEELAEARDMVTQLVSRELTLRQRVEELERAYGLLAEEHRGQQDRADAAESKVKQLESDAGWHGACRAVLGAAEAKLTEAQAEVERLRKLPETAPFETAEELAVTLASEREKLAKVVEALKSIAANTCCESCQEAALVARAALAAAQEEEEGTGYSDPDGRPSQ